MVKMDIILPFYLTLEQNYVKCGYYLRAATITIMIADAAATIQGRLLIKGGYYRGGTNQSSARLELGSVLNKTKAR